MQIITVAIIMVTMVGLNRLLLKLFIKTNYFNDKTKLFINVKPEIFQMFLRMKKLRLFL